MSRSYSKIYFRKENRSYHIMLIPFNVRPISKMPFNKDSENVMKNCMSPTEYMPQMSLPKKFLGLGFGLGCKYF